MRTVTVKKQAAPAFRMTPQRAELLRLLDGNRSHPSAEDLYARLSRKFPGVSLATVYNILESLVKAGRLLRIATDSGRGRFDPFCAPHAHLMCVDCGCIADLRVPPEPPAAAGRPAGFKVLRYSLDFYGVCPACGKKKGKKETKSCAKKRKR